MLRIDNNILKGFLKEEREIIKQFHHALYHRDESVELSVDNIVVIVDYLLLLDHPEGYVEAAKLLQMGLRIAPDDVDLRLFKAQLHLLYFQPDQALRVADELINEQVSEALVVKAQVIAQQRTEEGDQEVLRLMRQYAETDRDGSETVYLDVINYRPDRISYNLYHTVLKEVIKNDVDSGRSLNSVSIFCNQFNGETQLMADVVELYQLYLHHHPYDLGAQIGYAEGLNLVGAHHEAAELAEVYVRMHEDDLDVLPPLLLDVSDYLIQAGDFDKAQRFLERYLELRPDAKSELPREMLPDVSYICGIKHSFHMMMGLCLHKKGENEQAIKYFDAVAEREDLEQSHALRELSRIYGETENFDMAEKKAVEAIEAANGTPYEMALSYLTLGQLFVTYAIADTHRRLLHLNDAYSAFTMAQQQCHNLENLLGISLVRLMQYQYDEAREWLQPVIEEDGNNVFCNALLIALDIAENNWDEAEKRFRALAGHQDFVQHFIIEIMPDARIFFKQLSL